MFLSQKYILTPALRHLLFNDLIQLHFTYAYSTWYPDLTKKMKHRIQTTESKCMHFCLQLDKSKHIFHGDFERSNRLLVTFRFKPCVNSIVFKYFNEQCPSYLNDIFDVAKESNF